MVSVDVSPERAQQVPLTLEVPLPPDFKEKTIPSYLRSLHKYGMFLKLGYSPADVPQRFSAAGPEKVAKIQTVISEAYKEFKREPRKGITVLSREVWRGLPGDLAPFWPEAEKIASPLIDWLVNPRSLRGEPEDLATQIYFDPEIYAVFPRKGEPLQVRFFEFDELILRTSGEGQRANLLDFTASSGRKELTLEQRTRYALGKYAAWEIYQQFSQQKSLPPGRLRVRIPFRLPIDEAKHCSSYLRHYNLQKEFQPLSIAFSDPFNLKTSDQLLRYELQR